MRFIAAFGLIFVINEEVFSLPKEKPPSCEASLTVSAPRRLPVSPYRQSQLVPYHKKNLELGGTSYRILGLLGSSSTDVLLAFGSDGTVVIKVQMSQYERGIAWIWREIAVTEYFLSLKERVPRVLGIYFKPSEDEHSPYRDLYVVKEYVDGITLSEMNDSQETARQALGLSFIHTIIRMHETRDHMKALYNGDTPKPSFRAWYRRNKKKLIQTYPELWNELKARQANDPKIRNTLKIHLNRDVDDKDENVLLRIENGEWILFDP